MTDRPHLYGQSWKLNSGVTKIVEDGQCYLFEGYSGSVYRCHKNAYGTVNITAGMLASWKKEFEDAGRPDDLMVMPEQTNFMEIDYAN
jgi:hypothetical protein